MNEPSNRAARDLPVSRQLLDQLQHTEQALRLAAERTRALVAISQALADANSNNLPKFDFVTRRLAELLGDYSLLLHASEDGRSVTVASNYAVDPESARLLEQLDAKTPLPASFPAGPGAVIIPDFVPDAPHDAALWEHSRGRTLLIAPLPGGIRPAGLLVIARNSPGHPYDDGDRRFLQEVARRVAGMPPSGEPEGGRPCACLREQVEQDETLARLTHSFAVMHTDREALCETITRRVAEATQASCAIALLSPEGKLLVTAYHHADPELGALIGDADRAAPIPIEHGLLREVLATGRPLLIPDLAASPLGERVPAPFRPITKGGRTSLCAVALRFEDNALGLLMVGRTGANSLNAADLDAIGLIGEQASLAMYNAELHALVHDRLRDLDAAQESLLRQQQHDALLASISELLARDLDLPQLLERAVKRIGEAIGDGCFIRLLSSDGHSLDLAAHFHRNPEVQRLTTELLGPDPMSMANALTRTTEGEGIFLPELDPDRFAQESPLPIREFARRAPFHALIMLPLRAQGASIGVIGVSRHEPGRPYSEEDLSTMKELAYRVGLAVANARLYEEAQWALADRREAEARLLDQLERSRLLAEVSEQLARGPLLAETLDVVVRRIGSVIGDGCFVYLLSQDGEHLDLVAHYRPMAVGQGDVGAFEIRHLRAGEGLTGRVVQTGEPLFVPEQDPDAFAELMASSVREHSRRVNISGMVTVPLQASGRTLGALGVARYAPNRPYSEDDLATMQELADRIALGIANRRLATARQTAERELRQLNEQLEQRVEERTAQLLAANHELESFAYSISHDLRGPLRAIDGFSAMLSEDLAPEDEEQIRRLDVIRRSAQRMSQLIDDLLRFSRAGRTEIVRQRLDMEGIVREVLGELEQSSELGRVEVEVRALPAATADPSLIRQVVSNLLVNAIKFSAPKDKPRIEIGGAEEAEEMVYYVRDNGVGFDMDYAHKLFQVFSRLHSVDDFEGTGIGLALARRIVDRHGGRVWAESVLGEGATFWFSLPK